MRALMVATLLCLPVAAMAQESDKDFLTRFLEENLSSAGRVVTITGFAGALSSRATMAEMTIADDMGVWLTVRDVSLDWSQSALLSGQIVINDFSAAEIDLARMPHRDPSLPKPEAQGFTVPDLPVSIDIQSIQAPHIVLGSTVLGQAVEGALQASMQLAGGEGKAALTLKRTDQGPSGEFGLSAEYVAQTAALSLNLTAREGAGGVAATLLGVPGAPSAELTVQGSGPLTDFAADVALRTDGVMRLGGQISLFGNAGNTGFEANLSGDPTPVFLPQYAAFFGPDVVLHAKGQRFADGRMELSALHVAAEALTLDGLLNIDANGQPSSFALTGKMGLPDGSVVLPLTTERETRLYSADLTLNYSRIAGDIWQGKASVEGLDHADFKAAHAELTGSGHITSTPGFDGRIDFVTQGLAATDPALAKALGTALTGQAVLNWQEGQDFQVSNLSLAGDGFAIATTGTIGGVSQAFALTGTARGNYADLSRLADLTGMPLRGDLNFDLQGTGTPLTGMADLEGRLHGDKLAVGISQLDGLLADASEIALSVKRNEAGTEIRHLTVDARGLTADIAGRITSAGLDLTGDVALADARILGPGYAGSLSGKATLGGPIDTALLTLDAATTDLAIGQPQLDGLLRGPGHLALTLRRNAEGAAIEQVEATFATGMLTASGQVGTTANDLSARLVLNNLTVLNLGLAGALTGLAQFTGMPDKGRLTLDAQATALRFGQVQADRLLAGTSRLTADLDLTPNGVGVTALNLTSPQITVAATGTVTGSDRSLKLQTRLANLGLLYPHFPGALQATGTASQNANGYVLDLAAKGPGQIDARVKGTMANSMRSADLAISGSAAAALANIIVAPRSVSGALRYDLRLRGPLAPASLSGTVSLSGGRIADPAQNFALGEIAGTAQMSGGQARISASGKVTTGGSIGVTGMVAVTPPMVADLDVTLDRVTLRDPDLYTTKVDGALTITGPLLGGAVVAGNLVLGKTELRIPSTGFGSDAAMADLRHLHEPGESLATRARAGQLDQAVGASTSGRTLLNIKISAPNQVFIRGRGLDAELGGSLTLRGSTADIIPSGAFNLIRGRLDILGRRLNLSEALLQLQGALVPYIRILASVESDGITASVLIEGVATDPKVSFTSSPDLPEEEVLARLLFDRGLDTVTAFQAVQLAGAVATLAGKGGEGVVGNLRKKAGLDNLDVTSDATGATTVTVGKYLTEKVYTEVEVKQGKSSVSLNLDLAPHITLKGQVDSAGQTGIGIFLQRDY